MVGEIVFPQHWNEFVWLKTHTADWILLPLWAMLMGCCSAVSAWACGSLLPAADKTLDHRFAVVDIGRKLTTLSFMIAWAFMICGAITFTPHNPWWLMEPLAEWAWLALPFPLLVAIAVRWFAGSLAKVPGPLDWGTEYQPQGPDGLDHFLMKWFGVHAGSWFWRQRDERGDTPIWVNVVFVPYALLAIAAFIVVGMGIMAAKAAVEACAYRAAERPRPVPDYPQWKR